MILAITGGTGFVGSHLIDHALETGHTIRALARKPQAKRIGVTWIEGALDRPKSLATLVDGADIVIHVAGVVNVPDRAAFAEGNIAGTEAILKATRLAGIRRFIHVSSLAAREPGLSNYGWSKGGAEDVVTASALDWTIVRPPGVYGPGDMEQRDLFRAARRTGVVPIPPRGRLSIIHVADLARLLLALAEAPGDGAVYEASDGHPLSYADFARAIGAAVGRRAVPLPLPAALLRTAARADRLLRGRKAKLTADRVAYMVHPDWTADPAKAPPPALWQPQIAAAGGLAETARWYRAHGLL